MKIKYDISKKSYDLFNESQGIVTFRNDILKNIYNIKTYTEQCKKYILILIIILGITLIFNLISPYSIFTKILWFLFAMMAAIVTMFIFVFIYSYNQYKSLKHSGEIQFSKNGILDISDSGVRTGVTWELVDFIVITDTIIVILTKTNFYYHFDQELIDDILIAVNKYCPNIKILDASITRYRDKVLKELEENNKKKEDKKPSNKKEDKNKTVKDIKEIEEDIIKEIQSPIYEEYKDDESITK